MRRHRWLIVLGAAAVASACDDRGAERGSGGAVARDAGVDVGEDAAPGGPRNVELAPVFGE